VYISDDKTNMDCLFRALVLFTALC